MGVRAIVGALLLAALGACIPQQVKPREPLKANFDTAKRDAIWQAAVVVLQEQNYPIQLLDQASGTISTGDASGVSNVCSDGARQCTIKDSVSLTLGPTGVLILNVNRQVYTMGAPTLGVPAGWQPVQFVKDVQAVEARQKELGDLMDATAAVMRDLEPTPTAPSAAPSEAPAPGSTP